MGLFDVFRPAPVDAAEELRREAGRTPGGAVCWTSRGGFDVSRGVGSERKTEHFHDYLKALAFVREGEKK